MLDNIMKNTLIYENSLSYVRQRTREISLIESTDEIKVALKRKLQEGHKSIRHLIAEEDYEHRIVRQSGALLNSNWSVEILHGYVGRLRPEFVSMIRGPFYFYINITEVGYICYIVLPLSAPMRYFNGKSRSTKEKAKQSAAFEAVLALYKKGFISSDLKSTTSDNL